MIIDKEVLNIKRENNVDYTKIDLFEYTLEVAAVMNDDISVFMEAMGSPKKKIFDFEGIINAIIDALINAIKKLFGKFLAFLAQLASMGASFEIELRAFKEKIKAFTGDVRLDFPYYEFTNLDESVPGHDIYESIEDILQFYAAQYDTFISRGGFAVHSISELDSKIKPDYEQNKFRNRLFGRKNDFDTDCSDYAVKLNTFFRNNNDTPINGVVLSGSRIYKDFYIPYVDAKGEIRKIKREQNNIEKEIRVIKQHINKNYFDLSKINQFSAEDQSTLTASVTSIQRKLCTAVDLMSQDLLMFFGQKLQAYKDFKAQCRKVLVLTIKACITQGG